jgi:integrase
MFGATDGGNQAPTATESRQIVLGTAEQLRDLSSARQMTSGLMREINATDIRMAGTSITVAQLADHFQQRELGCSNGRISYSTKKAYQGYLGKWIVPRWGDYILPNIKAVEVELWLKHLQRAPGTCCKIRNVMSALFNHARRYDLYDHNPIQWVRQIAVLLTSSPATRSGNCWRWNHGSESWSYWM